jgi:hypothetical protein
VTLVQHLPISDRSLTLSENCAVLFLHLKIAWHHEKLPSGFWNVCWTAWAWWVTSGLTGLRLQYYSDRSRELQFCPYPKAEGRCYEMTLLISMCMHVATIERYSTISGMWCDGSLPGTLLELHARAQAYSTLLRAFFLNLSNASRCLMWALLRELQSCPQVEGRCYESGLWY